MKNEEAVANPCYSRSRLDGQEVKETQRSAATQARLGGWRKPGQMEKVIWESIKGVRKGIELRIVAKPAYIWNTATNTGRLWCFAGNQLRSMTLGHRRTMQLRVCRATHPALFMLTAPHACLPRDLLEFAIKPISLQLSSRNAM